MFIVFEWLDWSWKDTQLNKTFLYLTDMDKYLQIWKTREPTNNTEAWRSISQKLKWEWFKNWYEAVKLYIEDRIQQSDIRRDITKHSVIMSSRFDYSTYAYQWAQWLSFDEMYEMHDYEKILLPDITFFYDVSMDHISKRLQNRWWTKEFFENIDFLTKVREKYLEAIDRLKTQRKIYIIDANDDIEKVFDKTKNIINKEFWFQ